MHQPLGFVFMTAPKKKHTSKNPQETPPEDIAEFHQAMRALMRVRKVELTAAEKKSRKARAAVRDKKLSG
jgi:hypothetical protein